MEEGEGGGVGEDGAYMGHVTLYNVFLQVPTLGDRSIKFD